MIDFNIGDKAHFEQKIIEIPVSAKAGEAQTRSVELGDAVFCLKSASWKYSVEPGNAGDYGWPKTPMRVTLADAFSDKTGSPQTFSPPKLLRSIDVNVINPASIPVTTSILLEGTLITPNLGEFLPSDKEILGYVSLSPSQRGMLDLNRQMLMQMSQQFHAITGSEPLSLGQDVAKALPTSDIDEDLLKSLLIGDLATCDLETPLELDVILKISKALISKGWKRGN